MPVGTPARYRDAAIAHVFVTPAAEAIAFYREAFDATELLRVAGADGGIVHAEIQVYGALVMIGDPVDGFVAADPQAGASYGLHLYVPDVDRVCAAAATAGAHILSSPSDMFYGDRMAMVRDPFGVVWVFLTHQEDLSPAEIARRGAALLAG